MSPRFRCLLRIGLVVLFGCWTLGQVPAAFAMPAPVRVPILMYHYIRANPNRHDTLGADLSVTPQHFAAQMALLVAAGYQTITLDDLVAALREDRPLPPHPVILTFDDGYADFYTTAYPILARYGLRATSFVITGRVGRPGYLTWDEMRTMQAGGLVQFESHTVDHVELNRVSRLKAEYELDASRAALEQHLGVPIEFFCYPSGRYNAAVETLVARAGYEAALSTQPGMLHRAGDLLALSRVRVHGAESLAAFAWELGIRGAH
jgi:peptidoglycan/xylan/chitin deacetylase (PgdA/CDA1 family)